MKDKIDSILLNIYEQVQDGIQWDKAANELTALMCYREVRAMYTTIRQAGYKKNPHDSWVFTTLIKDYTEDIILKAIEQVKTDQP